MITYVPINLTNRKFYIGSTVDFDRRWKGHLNSPHNYPFQNSLRNDPENFFVLISEDDGTDSREEEQFYLDFYCGSQWCYNLSPKVGQPAGWKGKNLSQSHVEKLRELNTGENNPMFGVKRPWHSERMSGDKNPCFGRSGEKHPRFGKKDPEHSEAMKKCKWWVNKAGETKFEPEHPGEGWKPGRKWRN
jgi:group I intron endonuclease